MGTKKVLAVIFSLLFIGAFAFVLTWGIINFNKVKDGMSGTELFDKQDLTEAYEDGYNTALDDKTSYETQINEYKDKITELSDTISRQTIQINKLNSEIEDLNEQLKSNQISIYDYQKEIEAKNNEIKNLNTSISYYTKLLDAYQDDSKVIATFMYNDTVYNVQVLEIGSSLSVGTPESTEFCEFVGWSIDGSTLVDFETYTITEDTTFTAVVLNKYDVKFICENETIDTQIVEENTTATMVSVESTDNKVFRGWSLDGTNIVDVSTILISENTTFYAVIDYYATITYISDGTTYYTNYSIIGSTLSLPSNPTKSNYDFLGWSLNGINIIDTSTYIVESNTELIALFKKCQYRFLLTIEDYDAFSTAIYTTESLRSELLYATCVISLCGNNFVSNSTEFYDTGIDMDGIGPNGNYYGLKFNFDVICDVPSGFLNVVSITMYFSDGTAKVIELQNNKAMVVKIGTKI